MIWRLGLDLGTNSVGWWALRIVEEENRWHVADSLDGGVRIFSDGREPPKNNRVSDSRAVNRRLARGMRRNRDHGVNRMSELVAILIELDLLPNDTDSRADLFQQNKSMPDQYNPYRLRAEALVRPLASGELGRALQHLGRRRGFKSNRKLAGDDDGGKLKERIDCLRQQLGGQTLGQYLWTRYQAQDSHEKYGGQRTGIRFRGDSDIYPDRAMYAEEFDAIRNVQAKHHTLSSDDWQRIRDLVLEQYPLRPVDRGRCEFFTDQPRHWLDTPIGHDYRIYQELNNLRWIDTTETKRRLDRAQRDAVLKLLLTRRSDVKFAALRKLKRADKSPLFPPDCRFNLEDEKRKGLKNHGIAAKLAGDPILAPLWAARGEEDRRLDDIFTHLHEESDDTNLRNILLEECGVTGEQAAALMRLPLGKNTAHVSRRFMEALVPIMRDQGLRFDEAVLEVEGPDGAPLHHSLRDDNRRWPRLPYYGAVMPHSMLGADPEADATVEPERHFGRINNPTVHVALNQLRKLINELCDRFGGPPRQVHVELARELKQSRQKRDAVMKDQARHQRDRKRIVDEVCRPHNIPEPSALDIKKVQLWEELGEDQLARRCVFSGQPISAAQLFNGEAEIEHLLPFRRTLDDSRANQTVALRWANRLKGNNTPWEAFGSGQWDDRGIVWDEVLTRVASLPENKRWRFAEDAMARYEEDGGFIARQQTDNAYIARVAQRYLRALEGVEQVVPNRGGLTHIVRGKWGLSRLLNDDNVKTRDDHRHHAIDAAVIALTDRSVLAAISKQSGRGADDRLHLAVPELPAELREAIQTRIDSMIVSHKPDHGLSGKMYKETAYGFVSPARRDPDFPDHNLVARKPLVALSPKDCAAIRDVELRRKVAECLYEAKGAGIKHDKALAQFSRDEGIRRARILVKDQTVSPIPSAPYKGYQPDSYVCCDIWRLPKGKPGKWRDGEYSWRGEFWSYDETVAYAAAGTRPDKEAKRPHPAAKFVMRVYKNDLVSYRDGGQTPVMRVAGFSTTNNKLDLKPHHLADAARQYISINKLGSHGLRLVSLTITGVRRWQ